MADGATRQPTPWEDEPEPPRGRPRQIGRYRIRRLIGSGGMGAVYEAVQDAPRRTVALKVIKPGVASRSVMRRFEYEAQLLARLRHPHIAQIYEAGAARPVFDDHGSPQDGAELPYFAMEYIPGAEPITDYVVRHRLSTRERLALFELVCNAVQHGHSKGIIHRDLKPANILVDSSGAPKIIDFGVARATDSDLAVTTLQTDVGQLIGTIQYMSPEQCAADPHDIDTRSDVYALGVVLYELLTEALPYDVTNAAIYEAARIVRESLPTRPSSVNKYLRGDIETITLKALEKERDRRYRSANDLADDIRRYLHDQPIEARPPSLAYQLRKYAKRNRPALAAVCVLLVGLIAGIAGLVYGLTSTISANTSLREARNAEAEARREAEAQRDLARTEALRATMTAGFLESMFEAITPERARGEDSTLIRAVLDEAASRADDLVDEPSVEADIRLIIGNVYALIGEYDLAEPQVRDAVDLREDNEGLDEDAVTAARLDLAKILTDQRRLDEAIEIVDSALAKRRARFGEDRPETLSTRQFHARLIALSGEHERAAGMFEDILADSEAALDRDDPIVTLCRTNLAREYMMIGRVDDAERPLREAIDAKVRRHGREHPFTMDSIHSLGMYYYRQQDYEQAERFIGEAYDYHRRVWGEHHPRVLYISNNLGVTRYKLGKYAEAVEVLSAALDVARETYGAEHTYSYRLMEELSRASTMLGDLETAEPGFLAVYERCRREYGDGHGRTREAAKDLAWMYRENGRESDAEAWAAIAETQEPDSASAAGGG